MLPLDGLEQVHEHLQRRLPRDSRWSLRFVEGRYESIAWRQDVLQPLAKGLDRGALLTLMLDGGLGYAATADLSQAGLERVVTRAMDWARATRNHGLIDPSRVPLPSERREYAPRPQRPWGEQDWATRIAIVRGACARLAIDSRIVDWHASVTHEIRHSHLLTSLGGHLSQRLEILTPRLGATANAGGESQHRSGIDLAGRQGGIEQLEAMDFPDQAHRVATEAIDLLQAPNCPTAEMDLILAPSQMALQIHESIGHPLELDRILGDERNYAGTSFVRPDMFGSYPYGSPLLNVCFDPTDPAQLGSYGFDDEGSPAAKVFLIRRGILERPLGATLSQLRAGLHGTANARACHWSRPPIDRMANINLEPDDTPLADLIADVDYGVFMDSNRSWSIDDSRNKFQFGCEYARMVRHGELAEVVRNPNYRGISATFWRSLDGVGDSDSRRVLGVSNCGKGEPNQSIYVGHASPACLFRQVAVFGGAD
jgi:predicted Zn-dependent protease